MSHLQLAGLELVMVVQRDDLKAEIDKVETPKI